MASGQTKIGSFACDFDARRYRLCLCWICGRKHLVSGAEIRTFEPIFIGIGEPCTKKNRLKTVNATFSLLHIE